jgi:hypothetical protein
MKRLDIIEIQNLASARNGKLLSLVYVSSKQKLLWQCQLGHRWMATLTDVKYKNSWCPACVKLNKPDISSLYQVAIARGGTLLSSVYNNNRDKLIWKCDKGHVWSATWNNIKDKNQWCPVCKFRFKTENIVRDLLEAKLSISLKKARFFMPNRGYFEFDGYNEEHKIAFEYHGYQHYIYPNRWHKTEDAFNKAKQRDKDKEQYCIDNNIKLIIIPYTEENKLKQYISNISVY